LFQLSALKAGTEIFEILLHERDKCDTFGKVVLADVMGAVEEQDLSPCLLGYGFGAAGREELFAVYIFHPGRPISLTSSATMTWVKVPATVYIPHPMMPNSDAILRARR